MKLLYQITGGVILTIAATFFFVKVLPMQDAHAPITPGAWAGGYAGAPPPSDQPSGKPLLHYPHFLWAVAAQFFCVAAQGTWAFFINHSVERIGLLAEKASYYFALSMMLMMTGHFLGTFLMRYIALNKLLATFALGSILMCRLVAQILGWPSFITLLVLNFFFRIMFPTIFSLGLKELGGRTQQASSFLVVGVVGGAVSPSIMGLVANHNVAAAYYLPIICYAVIFLPRTRLYRVR